MKGFFEEMQERQKMTEEFQASLSARMETLRKERLAAEHARRAADAMMSLAIGAAGQKTEALSAKTESLIAGVEALGEGQQTEAQAAALGRAGAAAVQTAAMAGTDMERSIGIFGAYYPEWIADGGTEELHHITQYNGTAYLCVNQIQRYAHYAPDKATNNYCPYPAADSEGVYPYISGMLVWGGMKVKGGDGEIYRCTLTEGTYKLVNEPGEAASIFEIELPFS